MSGCSSIYLGPEWQPQVLQREWTIDLRKVFEPPVGVHKSECVDCDSHFFSSAAQRTGERQYTRSLTDAEAETKIRDHLKNIQAIRDHLADVLETHGDLILSRWSKKSTTKRLETLNRTKLLGASQELAARPEEDSNIWYHDKRRLWIAGRWLNFELFSEDRMRLLSLLHNRVVYYPADWAVFDVKESWLCFNASAQDGHSGHYFNANCVSLCKHDYGKIVPFDDKLFHSWAIAGFPRGYMTISVQDDIMSFLYDAVNDVIGDAQPTGCSNWGLLVGGGLRGSGSDVLWSSYTNAAFAPPLLFDPSAMLVKAESRLHMVLDEIELMQTDPGYMRYALRTRKVDIGNLEGTCGTSTALWSKLAGDFVREVHQRTRFWHLIVNTLKDVLKAIQAEDVTCGRQISGKASKALTYMEIELLGHTCSMSQTLWDLMTTLGSKYKVYQHIDFSQDQVPRGMTPSNPNDRVAFQLSELRGFLEVLPGSSICISMCIDAVERELMAHPNQVVLDKRMMDCLSDIAAMDELCQLCHYNQVGHYAFGTRPRSLYAQPEHYRRSVVQPTELDKSRLGVMMKSFYDAPWPKGQKNLDWLEKATRSRRKLASFWEVYREVTTQNAHRRGAEESELSLIDFDKSPHFLAELESERKQCEEASNVAAQRAAEAALAIKENEIQTTWGNSTDGLPPRRKQTKAKTARQASTFQEDVVPSQGEQKTAEPEDLDVETLDEPPIPVKQDSLSVFDKMYPLNEQASGTVRWQQFVQAMVDAGLVATNTGGSTVAFTQGGGRVVVHRPHPSPVMEPELLEAIGKRMRKWFDFHRERFVLRQKGEVE